MGYVLFFSFEDTVKIPCVEDDESNRGGQYVCITRYFLTGMFTAGT